jgi:hypothetical protein
MVDRRSLELDSRFDAIARSPQFDDLCSARSQNFGSPLGVFGTP